MDHGRKVMMRDYWETSSRPVIYIVEAMLSATARHQVCGEPYSDINT